MKASSRISLALAGLAIASTALAQPQVAAKPCLMPEEVETLVSFTLPSFVEGLARKCGAALPASAYLRNSAAPLAARYRRESPVPWTKAQPVLEKLGGERFPQGLGGEFGATLMETVLTAALVEQIQPKDCATADRIVETLAPLPAANTARLAGMLLALGSGQEKDNDMPFRLCPPVRPAR